MKFSLVLATVGRSDELKRFLRSLSNQTCRAFELIVIDQNDDDRVTEALLPYLEEFSIVHLRSARGLSRARNAGLAHLSGEVVAFPDDDCWYPPTLLQQINVLFSEHPQLDGVTGASRDGQGAYSSGNWDRSAGLLNVRNVWRRAISFTIFLRRSKIEAVGEFDEQLGVGAGTTWGSGEETDYLIRAINAGATISYFPQIIVHHPQAPKMYDVVANSKAASYGAGMGRVLRKHSYPWWFVLYYLSRSFGGVLVSLATGDLRRASHYAAIATGRYRGWSDSRPFGAQP